MIDRRNMRIFKCKVEGKEIKNPIYYDTYDLVLGKKIYQGLWFPIGTKSFPSITLIK